MQLSAPRARSLLCHVIMLLCICSFLLALLQCILPLVCAWLLALDLHCLLAMWRVCLFASSSLFQASSFPGVVPRIADIPFITCCSFSLCLFALFLAYARFQHALWLLLFFSGFWIGFAVASSCLCIFLSCALLSRDASM